MVFRKQKNEYGNYIDNQSVRWDIQSCERTESMEWYDTGEVDAEGEPIWAERVVINKGWDEFESEEAAATAWGLVESPLELDSEEEVI